MITLRNVILSYPKLFHPDSFDGNTENAKYSTSVIIKKGSPNYKLVESEYNKVLEKGVAAKKIKRNAATPLIRPVGSIRGIMVDCDEDPDKYPPETYAGCCVLSAKSKRKPGVFDRMNYPIDDEEEIYGGAIADVSIDLYVYTKPSPGITSQLNGVRKVGAGTPFGKGRSTVDEMFGAPIDDDDLFE